jgi:hypothetical protein
VMRGVWAPPDRGDRVGGFVMEAVQAGSGIAGSVVVMLVCVGQFVRNRWPGLLFWFGAALGACVAQGVGLAAGGGLAEGGLALATNAAIGGVVGMLVGGAVADLLEERQRSDAD